MLAQEDPSPLESYGAGMLAFFLRELGANAEVAQGVGVPRLARPERLIQQHTERLRAAGWVGAVTVQVRADDETEGVLLGAVHSLEDGVRTAGSELRFTLPEKLSFLARAEQGKLTDLDSEWLDLLQRVFPPLKDRPAALEGKLAWAEGECFFGSRLWEQAVQRLRELDCRAADACVLRLAFALAQAGMGEEALERVETALRVQPDSGPLYALKAWLVLRGGDAEDALMLLEQARLCDVPHEGYYWLARYLVALERKQDEMAEQFVVRGADLLPDEPFAQLKAARHFWRRARLEASARFYRRALAAGDNSPETWLELGRTLEAAGRRPLALDAFRQAFNLEPSSLVIATGLSSLLRSMERHEAALEVLRQAAEARPDRVELLAAYGDAAAAMWRTAQAQAAYARAVEQDPQFDYGGVGLAEMLTRQRLCERARELLTDLLQARPDYQPARIALGRTLARMGRHAEALDALATAARSPGYEGEARLATAEIQCRLGEYDEAVRSAQIAVAARPTAEAYGMLARAFIGLQNWENAEIAVNRALEVAPSAPAAHIAAGRFKSAREQHEQALAALSRAVELDSYCVEALVLAGRACLDLGRPADCAERWKRAAALDQWDPDLHWSLAELLRANPDDPRAAVPYYRRHIELGGAKADEAARILEQMEGAPPE